MQKVKVLNLKMDLASNDVEDLINTALDENDIFLGQVISFIRKS